MKDDNAIAVTMYFVVVFLTLAGIWLAGTRLANGHHSDAHNVMLQWIPAQCCVTNDCCFEISERDVTALPNDMFRINASGQVVSRSGYSPDGRWYRCACDNMNGKWVVHPTANTRCLFVPAMGS